MKSKKAEIIILPKKKVKEKEPPVEYWQDMIKVFFDFCFEKFSANPSFDGSAPRDLKGIVLSLKKRSQERGIEWTQDRAIAALTSFLTLAYTETWLRDNFMLFILNRHKDKVFLVLQNKINGKFTKQDKFTREGVNAEFGSRNYSQK